MLEARRRHDLAASPPAEHHSLSVSSLQNVSDQSRVQAASMDAGEKKTGTSRRRKLL